MMTGAIFDRAFSDMSRDAVLSDDLLYRYELFRWWNNELPFTLFWMLNPSIADAAKDDATIRKCIGFAKRFGCGGLIVVNWFAWRATDPAELFEATHPRGPENHWHIRHAISLCKGPLIAAWGTHKMVKPLLPELPDLLGGRQLMCLGTNGDGSPKHPVYLSYERPLIDFPHCGKELKEKKI